jgi:diaminohydroxyphosphoribosylaminopyrimidine deaminase/5-amino-6-(5-phosphoribosylamino)uracil reductase
MARPYVTLKLATSLDGRIATASGESRWISGERARLQVQLMRADAAYVMIGAGTARADNPSLLARTDPAPVRQPHRVVVTTGFDIPAQGKLFESLDKSPLIVFGAGGGTRASRAALQAAGARIEEVAHAPHGLDVAAVLDRLGEITPGGVLAEGGGALAASLLAADAVDRIEWFHAPIMLGAEGRPAIGALELSRLADVRRWRRVAVREIGPDLWQSYERA